MDQFSLLNYNKPRFAGQYHPFVDIEWETRVCDFTGTEFECPKQWSKIAGNMIASKYMRRAEVPDWKGTNFVPPITDGKETSVKQVIHRVASFLSQNSPLPDENKANYYYDLCYLMVNQIIGFNTPAWINGGLYSVYGIQGSERERYWFDEEAKKVIKFEYEQVKPGMAACYLTDVEDKLIGEGGMYDYIDTEMRIFTVGAGNGVNVSKIRGRGEPISGGGIAEGIIPFLKIPDVSAGYIKSGGVSRRAARILVCDDDHPDLEEFINWKTKEEEKVRALAEGFCAMFKLKAMAEELSEEETEKGLQNIWNQWTDWTGEGYSTISGQQSNNSIRCSDEFMKLVDEGKNNNWVLRWRTNPEVTKEIPIEKLWANICEAAWFTGDPGIIFKDTTNDWNTVPHYGEIRVLNPCQSLDNHILTSEGFKPLRNIIGRGQQDLIGYDEQNNEQVDTRSTEKGLFCTQRDADVYQVQFSNGLTQKFTKNHRFLLSNGFYKELQAIEPDDILADRFSGNIQLFNNVIDDQEEYEKGLLTGWWFGDGWVSHNRKKGKVHNVGICVGQNDFDAEEELEMLWNKHIAPHNPRQFQPHAQKPDTCRVINSYDAESKTNAFALGFTDSKPEFEIYNKSKSYKIGFIEGLISSDGTVRENTKNGWRCRSLEIYSNHRHILEDVMRVMMEFGISCSISIHNNARQYVASDGKQRNNKTTFKLTTADPKIKEYFVPITEFKKSRLESWDDTDAYSHRYNNLRIVNVEYAGKEDVYDITVPKTSNVICGAGNIVHNCGEIPQPDYTTCNLCSLNLVKFLNEKSIINIEDFIDTAKIVTLSLETITGNCSHPTKRHAQTTRDLRPLGANIGNIGASLMRMGLPYDSEEGRKIVSMVAALLTGACYKASQELAEIFGPYPAYDKNNHYRIIKKHLDYISKIESDTKLYKTVRSVFSEMMKEQKPFRNDAVTCMVPTGTIGLIMDFDTFGMEPDFALVKEKTLSDGRKINIVNKSVPEALKTLGYENPEELVKQIADSGSVVGVVSENHEAVFDCAASCSNGRYISINGHLYMIGAIQPYISLSISKTVNLPYEAKINDISEAYLQAWKMGLKSLSVFRDGSKISQPLKSARSTEKTEEDELDLELALRELSEVING